LVYFQDKLEKIEKENLEDLEKLRKNFQESYLQKEGSLTNLINKMDKQRNILEEITLEREKRNNYNEEEMKFMEFSNRGRDNPNPNRLGRDSENRPRTALGEDDKIKTGNEKPRTVQ